MNLVQQGILSQRCVLLMDRLHKEFNADDLTSAAITGNAAHESAGFTEWHEVGQPANLGGIGLCMWTGPRRRLYEAFCEAHGYDAYTFNAGVEMLVHELKTTYHTALFRTLAATGLAAKTAAFEKYYEGAGIVREDDRVAYAEKALAAYHAAHPPAPAPTAPEA
jgi:hypothetical protein